MIVALCSVMALLAAPTFTQSSGGATLTSPCPSVFEYDPPGAESDSWSGVVTLSTDILLNSMQLNIVLDRPAWGFGQLWGWAGNITTKDNINFRIDNKDLQIHPGQPVTVRFFVQTEPLNKTPRLWTISLNGKVICNAKPLLSPQSTANPTWNPGLTSESDFFVYPGYPNPFSNAKPLPPSQSAGFPDNLRPGNTAEQLLPPQSAGYPGKPRPGITAELLPPPQSAGFPGNPRPGNTAEQLLPPQSAGYPGKPRPGNTAEQLPPPQSTPYPGYSRPVNNPGAVLNLDHLLSNTPVTTNGCGEVAGGNEKVLLINKGNFYERGEMPWLVAIYRIVEDTLQFICGGTLVSDRHVVTAAHCMQRPFGVTPMTEIVVKVGVHRLNDWSDDLTVTRQLIAATIHEDYNPNTLQNDVLILTLDKRVKFNRYIRPACLWSGDTELSRVVGATGVVAGWGDRSAEDSRSKLDEPNMVRVPIVSTKDCRASKSNFHQLTYNTTLCAGDRNGAGPCKGDSGGGLYLLDGGKWRLRGVVSLSLQNKALTCDLDEYVVFTDTAQFLPWIRNVLSKNYFD